MALGSPLDRIKLGKLMGGSGQPGPWRPLPQSFNADLGMRKKGSLPYLFSRDPFYSSVTMNTSWGPEYQGLD